MKFSNLMIGAVLAIAPLHATIIQSAVDPALALIQTFSSPLPSVTPNTPGVTTEFATRPAVGVSFLRAENLVYDPNPPAIGNCTGFTAPDANCITNFTQNTNGTYKEIKNTGFTFTLTNPAKQVAFFLVWDQINPTSTKISVNGGVQTATFAQNFGNPWYLVDLGGTNISSITISGIGATTAIANAGMSGYGLVLSHLEATTTPEPGTILMLGAGLGMVGLFARRRKA